MSIAPTQIGEFLFMLNNLAPIIVIKEGVYALNEIRSIKSLAIRKNFLNNLSYFKKVTTFVIGKQGCFK